MVLLGNDHSFSGLPNYLHNYIQENLVRAAPDSGISNTCRSLTGNTIYCASLAVFELRHWAKGRDMGNHEFLSETP